MDYLDKYIHYAKKHFISIDKNLWKLEQYQIFLEYRVTEIYSTGREVFNIYLNNKERTESASGGTLRNFVARPSGLLTGEYMARLRSLKFRLTTKLHIFPERQLCDN